MGILARAGIAVAADLGKEDDPGASAAGFRML